MAKIYSDITELIGGTPLIRLSRFAPGASILAKLERQNPAGSAKDRVALSMLRTAEAEGRLKKGGVVIEPTSGNTGIGLAALAAALGYKAVIVMPDSMSPERIKLIAAYGAEVVLTPGAEGMAGAVARAEEIAAANPGSIIAGQFSNPANPRAHYESTGPEIWRDTDGDVAAFSVGTSPSKALVAEMLAGAVAAAGGGFTLHSDRGWHYRTPDWVRACGEAGVERSMSRKGHSPDNAACEGFFGRLKVEFFHGRDWRGVSAERFAAELAEWIRWYREGRLKAFDEGGRKVYDTIAGRRRRLGLAA